MRVEPAKVVQKEEKPKKRRRISFTAALKIIKLLPLILIIAAVGFAWTFFQGIPKRFTFLVIGSDQRAEERGRSDVLMVVSVPKSPDESVSILTIPRDTRVDVPGFGPQKITHAYALGEKEGDTTVLGNRKLTERTVEEFLGIPIDATLELTFKSFEDLIDRLGGITTKTHGKLTGEKALKLVRNRSREGGDFARTEDQREILLEVVNEIRRQNAFQGVYNFLASSSESRVVIPKARFAMFALYVVVRRGGNMNFSSVHNDVVPGRGESIYTQEFGKNLYYWIPDKQGTDEIVSKWFS